MIRCANCAGDRNCIPGDGPTDSCLLFVGEAPGKDEDRKKRVFIGKTGREVNEHYLPLAGERRDQVRFTNAIKCLPPGTGKLDANREKDLELLSVCSQTHLFPEIEEMKPKLIIPMGAFACRAIDPDIQLDLQHGMPIRTPWGMTFPMWHPAGGIHEPKKMLQIRTDWVRLRRYLRGTLLLPQDIYAGKEDYSVTVTPKQLRDDLREYREMPLACDTEAKRGGEPFCLTYSVRPGWARLIRAENTATLMALQEELDQWRGPILFHNWWLYDWAVTIAMGLNFPLKRMKDTMVMVSHLGNQPQGLKALSYRHLGMVMQDFDDLVTPHSSPQVINYYRMAMAEDWPQPEEQLVRREDGKLKLYKPQSMTRKLKTFFTYLKKNPAKDVFETWEKNWADSHDMIQERMGPWPGKCISHVPFEEALFYACRDADALLRFWPVLQRARRSVRRKPEIDWFVPDNGTTTLIRSAA